MQISQTERRNREGQLCLVSHSNETVQICCLFVGLLSTGLLMIQGAESSEARISTIAEEARCAVAHVACACCTSSFKLLTLLLAPLYVASSLGIEIIKTKFNDNSVRRMKAIASFSALIFNC